VTTPLTDAVIADRCNKLRISGSLDTALSICGIERSAYDKWLEAAHAGTAEPIAKRLVDATQETLSEVKMMREHQLTKYFEKNWQALAWWLERKYPEEYAAPARVPDEDRG
jgi:hypothetical protein